MKKIIFLVVLIIAVTVSVNAFAVEVRTRSISAGHYEDGVFTLTVSGFEGLFDIDEVDETITLKKILDNEREGRLTEGAQYDITNIVISEGMSSLLVSRDKKGQTIYTAVREVELDSAEVLIIGEDFYEYSRAANGKFYLEYGEVKAE